MLSSGLFLLPGLAAKKAGPAVILAYAIAGLMAIPAMLSVAELSTAMPRAGGVYFFVDRALGPAFGTVAGLTTWMSLVLKDAFALVGMAAYLQLVVDLPGRPVALVLIFFFMAINSYGSHTSASLQVFLVVAVLTILFALILFGLIDIAGRSSDELYLTPFFETGPRGFIAAIGLIFVSYGGLTKVASAAEEIDDPKRTIPLGMMLALATGTVLYTAGAFLVVAVIEPDTLHDDLAPIYTAADIMLGRPMAVIVVVGAVAAFASATNAGILAAARYPLAMSRDGLLPKAMGRLSERNTPARGVVLTSAGMALVVALFDVNAIAKLASAFVLLTLGLVNLAAIVFRLSRITSYAPGFRAPFYPWLQLTGIAVAVALISQLGIVPIAMVIASVVFALAGYFLYGRRNARRVGAVLHVFERWGAKADRGLDRELREVMHTHGLRPADDYPGLIARAAVLSVPEAADFDEAATRAAKVLSDRIGDSVEVVAERFLESGSLWLQPSGVYPTATPIAFFPDLQGAHLIVLRSETGIQIPSSFGGSGEFVNALFFLAGSTRDVGRAMRMAGEMASLVQADAGAAIGAAVTEPDVKQALLPEHILRTHSLLPELDDGHRIGRPLHEVTWGPDEAVAAVVRGEATLRPEPDLVLEPDDQVVTLEPADRRSVVR
jgi:APA family basic amino acid/polyamine antiporter